MNTPMNTQVCKNLEAVLIALKRTSLNDQLDSNQLILFLHGVTYILITNNDHTGYHFFFFAYLDDILFLAKLRKLII